MLKNVHYAGTLHGGSGTKPMIYTETHQDEVKLLRNLTILLKFFEFYLNSSFTQSNFWRQLFSHKSIWIMCTFEYFFQCIQLTAWERCSIASWLFRWIHHATAVWCLIQMITRIRLFCEIKSRNNVALIKLCCPRYNETHSQVCTTLFNNDDFV